MSPSNSSDRFRRFSRIDSIASPLVTLRRPQLLSQCHVSDKRVGLNGSTQHMLGVFILGVYEADFVREC